MNLARRQWGSLVVIPADSDGSTAEIANALADIGQRLSYGPVTAITVSSLEYGSVLALADLQQHVDRERRNWDRTAVPVADPPDSATSAGSSVNPGRSAGAAAGTQPPPPAEAGGSEPQGQQAATDGAGHSEALMVVLPPGSSSPSRRVVTEPLGLAAAEQADAVVLAIRLNHSRMPEVRRTIQLIGRTRITGCLLLR